MNTINNIPTDYSQINVDRLQGTDVINTGIKKDELER